MSAPFNNLDQQLNQFRQNVGTTGRTGATSGPRRTFSFKSKSLSRRKSDENTAGVASRDSSGPMQATSNPIWGQNRGTSAATGSMTSHSKPTAMTSGQSRLTSFFNKGAGSGRAPVSAPLPSLPQAPSAAPLATQPTQRPKQVARVAPLSSPKKDISMVAQAKPTPAKPAELSFLLEDDDDFESDSKVSFTSKPAPLPTFPKLSPAKEGSDSEDEDVVRKRRKKRKSCVLDSDDGEDEPVTVDAPPTPVLATQPLFSQDPQESFEDGQMLHQVEDYPVPTSSPPELDALLELEEDLRMEEAAKGSEILPTISPPKPRTSPGVQRPLFKRQKTEAVGNVPSAAITQHNNHLLVSPNTASLNAIAQSTTPETTNVASSLQQDYLSVLEQLCDMVCDIKMADLLAIRSLDLEAFQRLLAKRQKLKSELEVATSTSKPASVAQPAKRPLFKFSRANGSSSNSASPLLPPAKAAPSSVSGDRFDVPCGDSFFEDMDSLPSTLASFKAQSRQGSPATPGLMSPPMAAARGFTKPIQQPAASTPFQSASTLTTAPRVSPCLMGPTAASFQFNTPLGQTTNNTAQFHDDLDSGDLDEASLLSALAEESYIQPASPAPRPLMQASAAMSRTPANKGIKPPGGITPVSASKHVAFRKEVKDDGKEFDGETFPHSEQMRSVFRSVFGLQQFRPNQLSAVNAAMLGHDCFILMPTGGGKSLCYQLPALVTPGITVVISPLRSLIQDQVQRLCSMDVPATHLSGDVSQSVADSIYHQLYMREPGIKLLYVTPEKLSASGKLLSSLDHLYKRQLLGRFVIDEAHCVSQWGHDFRPDYKKLHLLREKFPGVPMMALTATATPRVRKDILHQLHMKTPKWFMQSFNRHNLKYAVLPKKGKAITTDIINLIQNQFHSQSGIVYCLSRRECDQVSQDLRRAGIMSEPYHAGLSDSARIEVQERWLNEDKCKIVCATIAFGMGIDKPDVRFVIHYSLPKSIEGYYQESGRAGRDGRLATCFLYYSYSDVARLRRMVEMDQGATYETKKVHLDNLYRMVQYAENNLDCRRTQQLEYFGELFNREKCGAMPKAICDNCSTKGSYEENDVTEIAKTIVRCVQNICKGGRWGSNFTLLHFIEVFKGSKNAKVLESGHDKIPMHNLGKGFNRMDCERLLRHLVVQGILGEELQVTNHDTTVCYVRPGVRANEVLTGNLKVRFHSRRGKGTVASSDINKSVRENDAPQNELQRQCYNELIALCKETARQHGLHMYTSIFTLATMDEMSRRLPITPQEMTNITGVGKARYDNYGARFLEVTQNYATLQAGFEDFVDDGADDEAIFCDELAGEQSRFFHSPSVGAQLPGGGQGKSGGWKNKGGWKRKGGGKAKGRTKAAPRARGGKAGSSGRGKAAGNSGGSSGRGGVNLSQFKRPAAGGSTTGSTGRKPGFLGAPKSTRSFLGGSSMYMA